jgi:hypothetical protein
MRKILKNMRKRMPLAFSQTKMTMCLALLTFFISYGCEEDSKSGYIDDSAPAPAPVTLGNIKAKPGGAIIWYTVPNDRNLLGVKAVYERNGEICETKASVYADSLTVEGFGDANPKEVKLYSVGRNEKLSEPVTARVIPLDPPIVSVKLDMETTFGGVLVSISNNISNADLALILMVDTVETEEWIPLHTFYSTSVAMKYAHRGLESKEQKFGLYVKDRWNNRSEMLVKTLTPIEEIKLPKDGFRNAALPTDSYQSYANHWRWAVESLWDGIEYTDDIGFNTGSLFTTPTSTPMPQHVTIYLGRPMSISRMQMFPRAIVQELYSSLAVRAFELWGTTDPPADGSFDNWHRLGSWEVEKPSGYGVGSNVGVITDEDREWFKSGGNYEVQITDETPNPYMTVTYLRFRTMATFATYGTEATNGQITLGELTFYGQLRD